MFVLKEDNPLSQSVLLTVSQRDAAKRRQGDEDRANAVQAKGEPAGGHQKQKPRLWYTSERGLF